MKIVDYETFVRMPSGTIFAPWKPCVYRDRFEIKVDGGEEYTNWEGKKVWGFNGTMPLEPWNTDELFEGCDECEASFEVYDGDQNDASKYELFCVLDDKDVKKLINVLHWSLAGCPGDPDEYKKEEQEVRHGKWEAVIGTRNSPKWGNNRVACSECRRSGYTRYAYCPNCGAKMDGKNK